MKLLFLYDRWRGRTEQEKPQLQLAGPLEGGGFSFRLTPGGVKDGGLYCCEVFSNDNVFSQRTMLSVLKGRRWEEEARRREERVRWRVGRKRTGC